MQFILSIGLNIPFLALLMVIKRFFLIQDGINGFIQSAQKSTLLNKNH